MRSFIAKSRSSLLFLLLILVPFCAFSSDGSVSYVVSVDSTIITLRHRHVDPRSFRMESLSNQLLSAPADYKLNPTTGEVAFSILPAFDSLRVSYRYLPIQITLGVQHRKLISPQATDSLLRAVRRISVETSSSVFSFGKNLRSSGHLLRGVQIGTGKDLSMESGLHLALDGQLARGIEIRALLDDRSLPIQPEGTSQRLSDIDQVYIDVKAGKTRGRFGDYQLQMEGGRYGSVDRRLEGGTMRYDGRDVSVTAAGAVTKSVFHSNKFNGRDGIQGPYRLVGQNDEMDLIVIGDSEKIWVDGKPLLRGETNDYVIDYNRGEITFTPRFPITSESRIEIDFEYSPEAFPRNVYAGQIELRSPARNYQLTLNFLQEGDDPDNPIGFDMTPAIRSSLRDAGNAGTSTYVNTAENKGLNGGDYIQRDSTWTDGNTYSIFKFVTPDSDGTPNGNWIVPFAKVAAESGDYLRDYSAVFGTYIYRWVGPGNGDYIAARQLPLPERQRHGALAFRASPTEFLTLSSDVGLSDTDANTLSPLDDSGNVGLAQEYSAELAPWTLVDERKPLQFTMRYRRQGARYRASARDRDVEYERRWGVDTVQTGTREDEREARLNLSPLSGLFLSSGYGALKQTQRNEETSSERKDIVLRFANDRFRLSSIGERIHRSDTGKALDWARIHGNTSYTFKHVSPAIDGEWEDMQDNPKKLTGQKTFGHRYWRLRESASIEAGEGHGGKLFAEQRNRQTRKTPGQLSRSYNEFAGGTLWRWNPLAFPLRSEIELSHREKNFSEVDSADVTTNLAAIRAGLSPFSGALMADMNYRLSRTVSRPSALIAYQVPAGEGDYIRRDDEYIYDPEIGDIILRPEPTGDAVPTTDLAASLHFGWSPHRLPSDAGIREGFGWEDLSFDTQIDVVEISKWDRASDIYLLNLNTFQSDSTVEGRLTLRQDLYLFRPSTTFNARIRYIGDQRLNNLYQTGSEVFKRDVWELRLQNSFSQSIDAETNGRYERKTKDFARRSGAEHFQILRLGSRFSVRLNRIWKISTEIRGLLDQNLADVEPVRGLGVKPGITWSTRDHGRITAEFEALWVDASTDFFSFELADGRPRGRNGRGSIRADYRFGKHINGRLIYTVRLDQGRAPIQVARVEATAFF